MAVDPVVKVVRRVVTGDQTFLVSLHARDWALVCYNIGEWAVAPAWLAKIGYGLLIWEDLSAFTSDLLGAAWEKEALPFAAEAEDRIEPLPPMGDLLALDVGELELGFSPGPSWPRGSRMYHRVRLISLIEGGADAQFFS